MLNTILFGNGINRLSPGSVPWPVLLETIQGPRKFKSATLPNTMIYERIILERPYTLQDVLFDEFEVKLEIATLLQDSPPNDLYVELFSLNIQNFITTNYDYSFIDSIQELPEILLSIDEFSTEDVYSIRRLKTIRNTREKIKHFWQVHGEIRKPATIMLGLDHYCGSIGKIDNYIKGKYEYQENGKVIKEMSVEEKFIHNKFSNSSWVELFFNSNVHIIGFGLDFSEIDIWWVLNKRARMKKSKALNKLINNEIIFHCDSIDPEKKELLKSLDVKVHTIGLTKATTRYHDYYKNLLNYLRRVL